MRRYLLVTGIVVLQQVNAGLLVLMGRLHTRIDYLADKGLRLLYQEVGK